MVKYDNLLIEDIKHIGCIIFGLLLIFYCDVLEIAYRIKTGVAVETANIGVLASDLDTVDEGMDGFRRTEARV